MAVAATAPLRYLGPDHAKIAGERCEGMTIRSATGRALGRVQGFIVDPVARRLKYFVVRTSGLLGLTGDDRLVPITAARVNLEERAIELLADQDDLDRTDRFSQTRFPAFTDEDYLTAIFARN